MIPFILAIITYINAPVAVLREQPTTDSKVDSQAIYSEQVQVVETNKLWAKVKTSDNYSAWLPMQLLHAAKNPYPTPEKPFVTVTRNAAHIYHIADTEYGPIATLPFECRLEVVEEKDGPNGRWIQVRLLDDSHVFIQRGDITFNKHNLTKEEMVAFSYQFLGLPYTWGGRSSFGYDCSGFVQMLYRQMGHVIPRNSRQQIAWKGFINIPLDLLKPGDLIFFGPSAEKITHVGMYIGDGKFIHATSRENKPYIHISNLEDPLWNGSSPALAYRAGRTLLIF